MNYTAYIPGPWIGSKKYTRACTTYVLEHTWKKGRCIRCFLFKSIYDYKPKILMKDVYSEEWKVIERSLVDRNKEMFE